jgi:hypothetical protein
VIPALLHVTSIQSGGPRDTQKMIADAARDAAVDVVKYWHDRYLPEHFTVAGGKKYGYQPAEGRQRAAAGAAHEGQAGQPDGQQQRLQLAEAPGSGTTSRSSTPGRREQAPIGGEAVEPHPKGGREVVGTAAMPALAEVLLPVPQGPQGAGQGGRAHAHDARRAGRPDRRLPGVGRHAPVERAEVPRR